jgi:hypothetical protein
VTDSVKPLTRSDILLLEAELAGSLVGIMGPRRERLEAAVRQLADAAKAGIADTERVQALEGERYWHFKLYDEDDGFNGPTIQTPDGNFDTVRAAIDHIVSVRSGLPHDSEKK